MGDYGRTPLWMATLRGHTTIMGFLMERGCRWIPIEGVPRDQSANKSHRRWVDRRACGSLLFTSDTEPKVTQTQRLAEKRRQVLIKAQAKRDLAQNRRHAYKNYTPVTWKSVTNKKPVFRWGSARKTNGWRPKAMASVSSILEALGADMEYDDDFELGDSPPAACDSCVACELPPGNLDLMPSMPFSASEAATSNAFGSTENRGEARSVDDEAWERGSLSTDDWVKAGDGSQDENSDWETQSNGSSAGSEWDRVDEGTLILASCLTCFDREKAMENMDMLVALYADCDQMVIAATLASCSNDPHKAVQELDEYQAAHKAVEESSMAHAEMALALHQAEAEADQEQTQLIGNAGAGDGAAFSLENDFPDLPSTPVLSAGTGEPADQDDWDDCGVDVLSELCAADPKTASAPLSYVAAALSGKGEAPQAQSSPAHVTPIRSVYDDPDAALENVPISAADRHAESMSRCDDAEGWDVRKRMGRQEKRYVRGTPPWARRAGIKAQKL